MDDVRLSGLLKQAWLEYGGIYGYRKLTLDMRNLGERCGSGSPTAPSFLPRGTSQGEQPCYAAGKLNPDKVQGLAT